MRDLNFRPNYDHQSRPQDADAEPFDVDALIAFMNEALGPEYLAGIRAKYGSGNPDDHERRRATAERDAKVEAILSLIGRPTTPYLQHVTVAISDDCPRAAASAIRALVQAVRSDVLPSKDTDWGWSDVAPIETIIRNYRASLPANGAHRRTTGFSFSNPAPLSNVGHRLLVHANAGGKLHEFAASEGATAPWATKQRIRVLWTASVRGLEIPPSLWDMRRGRWSGPTEITPEQSAMCGAVLRRTVDKLRPLVEKARQCIEIESAAEVAEAVRDKAVKAGKAAAAARVAKRAAEKPPLTKEEREARAESALARVMERANTARERRRRKGETNEATPKN